MRKFNFKIIAAISPICVLAALFLYAIIAKPFSSSEIFCGVYEKTKICCPSCGLTRAIYSIAHGDFKTAFYYHALFTVGFIPFFIALTVMGINYACGNKLSWLKYRWVYFYLCLTLIIAFTIYRNFVNFIF